MINKILSNLIIVNIGLIVWICGVKFIKLMKNAIIELNKIGSDKND